jgi:signal transduction histidine kinase/CheY-like chemotaxis protein
VLTPLWLACFALSLLAAGRPVVLVPFLVSPGAAPGETPVITDFPPWTRPGALQRGDRVLAFGDASLAGAGRLRAAALAWAEATDEGRLEIVVERGGESRIVPWTGPVQPKWPTLLVSLGFALAAGVGLWLAPQTRMMQAAWPALMTTAFWMAGYFGREPGGLLAAFWVRSFAFVFMLPLYVRATRYFATNDDGAVRWARGWPALLAVNGLAVANTEALGFVPVAWSQLATHVAMAAGGALMLAIGVVNYRASRPRVRRRFRWLLLGLWVSQLPLIFTVSLYFARIDLGGDWWLASQLATLAVPLAGGIAVFRDDLFDVDRLLSSTLLLSVLGAAALVGFGAGAPAVSRLLERRAGFAAEAASALAGFLLAGGLLGLGVAGWQGLRRFALRGERRLEAEAERLFAGVAGCQKLRELAALLGDRLPLAWRTAGAAVYAGPAGALLRVHGPLDESAFPAAFPEALPAAWLAALEGAERPQPAPGADALLVPVRRDGELALVVALGPKRSGDVFTAHERALVAAVASRASGVLERLERDDLLAAARGLHEELVREKEALGHASDSKSMLLATAGHDLRQPLHALELFLAALAERVTEPEARALLERARGSARTVEQTFDGILDAARLDAGVLEPDRRDVPLAELFAELERDARPIADAKGLALRVRTTPLFVNSDPLLLRSILQNLLGNALRYTERGGVLLAARRRGGEVRIEVVDTGPGIEPGEQERLFRAWERGEARGDGGAGLGLALAVRMSRLLGHRLALRSRPGRGSRFAVSAPAAAPAQRGAPAAAGLRGAGGKTPTAALLDDDAAALEALEALLRGWGVDVVSATAPEPWLAAVSAHAPDVLLVDLRLAAGASGLDAVARARAALGAPVPALVLSGDRSAAAEAEVRAAGLLLLAKPVEPVRLRAALAHVLSREA